MLKKIIFIVSIIFFPLLAFGVKAIQPTQQYNKITIFPLYRESLTSNTNYTYTMNVNPPDGISSVISSIIFFNAQINGQTQNFTLWVNNKPCNNPYYYIATAFSTTGNTQLYFDCSNVINQSGQYNLTIRSAVNTGVISGWLDLTYMNNPMGEIDIHGTEYTIGQVGKIWVQVLDSNKTAVSNATCLVDIYTPDGLQIVEKEPMSFLEDGIYYYNFIVPDQIGVYPSVVQCYYVTSTAVNLASSGVVITGTTTSGDYTTTWVFDGVYWVVREISFGGKQRIQTLMNFSNVSQPALQSNLNIIWTGIWNSAPNTDSISMYIMNFTSGNWTLLPNLIDDTGGSELTYANSIATTNATASGLIKNGIVSILFNDTNGTDGSATLFKSDYVHVDVVAQFSAQYQQIIGSGEIHVSSFSNLPYTIETLCGEILTPTDFETMSACSIFTHDGEFLTPEGEIEGNITITALETKSDQYWTYITPPSVSCDAIYWLKYYNGTDWIDVDLSSTIFFTNVDSSCTMRVMTDFTKGETYLYHIKMDNYIKWEVDWLYGQIYNSRIGVEPTCNAYAIAGNYTYTIPILNGTVISNNTYLSTCHQLYDDFYWSEWYYNDSLSQMTSGSALADLYSLRSYANSINPRILLLGKGIIVGTIGEIKDGIKFIGGTEYNSGETGISSIQFIISNNPVEDGNCNITIYYPNGSVFILDGNATYLNGSDGIYSYNFTVPSAIGVYREEFVCRRGSGTRHYASGSFHNSDWANNITNIYQLLQYMNSTELIHFNSLYNLIVSVNSSINQNIISVNDSISNVLNQLQSIQNNLTLVYNLVNASNSTIMNKLFKIQDEITSVNDTIKAMNQSIENHLNNISNTLNSIEGDLNQIKGNLTEILALSQDINVTVNEIVGLLGNITSDISGLNSSLIAHIDTSLTNLEFNLTTIIISVNDTVLASNTTIMNKLYLMQDEIASLNQTIINGLMNISNVTVNITASQKEVINTMFALYGSQAKNRNYAYLGIGGGLAGFMAGGDSGAIYYCKDNVTLAQYSVQNITGSINMTNIYEDLQHCTYGCVQNACVIPQYMIWLYVLIALIAVFGLYLWLERYGWMSGD
jgi:hypothetical protein